MVSKGVTLVGKAMRRLSYSLIRKVVERMDNLLGEWIIAVRSITIVSSERGLEGKWSPDEGK